ncbi:helix-turn-helix domain-containing protein [Halosimplex amylolyticum]|uniref:helix-turn-helix domain-containing protein n=1 Tax=Halosimplex amylolyticum TaxID=3396616 RepID=UPI003F555DB9
MKRVRITLDPDEAAQPPVYERLTRDNALESVRIVNWNVATPPATFLLRLTGDYESFGATLAGDETVLDFELFPVGEVACHCYLVGEVGPAARALFENFTRGSLLTVPPIECHDDGSSTFTIVGTAADVQAAVDGLPPGSSVTVERVGGTRVTPDDALGRLSARQREALATAAALGYYDTERSATCETVAAEMGCATPTAAEHLRKAEATLVRVALDDVSD